MNLSKAGEAKDVLERVFGRALAEGHAARMLDEAPEPVHRVRSEYDPYERGLGS